jgi:hypothetical protein
MLVSLALTGPAVNAQTDDNDRSVASFTFSPSPPVTGEAVTFTSTSRDPDGRVASQAWDLDNDRSYDDGTGSTATRAFSSGGKYTVRLRVVYDDRDSRTTSRTVTVMANAPPVAAFSASPADPYTSQTVILASSSTDPDGRPVLEEWDLDNDGAFDDATGPQVTASFPVAGQHTVSLRLTDSGGSVQATFQDILVRNRPPDFLSPFPRVRVRGVTTATGARIDLLSVRTPGGTRILARCNGSGCPWARNIQRARFSAGRVRSVTIAGFSHRRLRAGAVIEVFVTREALIGKYTRIKIRRLRPPKRVDRCTSPGAARAAACPAG